MDSAKERYDDIEIETPTFNQDNWILLENDLRETPGWNHINSFKRMRDGRSAWKSLLNHYEGKQFQMIIRTKSFNTLKNT
jgi:hypothetical protein